MPSPIELELTAARRELAAMTASRDHWRRMVHHWAAILADRSVLPARAVHYIVGELRRVNQERAGAMLAPAEAASVLAPLPSADAVPVACLDTSSPAAKRP